MNSNKEVQEDAISQDSLSTTSIEADFEKTTDDLQHDIDSALAEVMSGLQSLEMQQRVEKTHIKQSRVRKLEKMPPAHPKHTPDLVLDLPISSNAPPSPKDHSDSDSEHSNNSSTSNLLSTAEVFANANQSTIKKGSSMPRGSSTGISSGLQNLSHNKKRSVSSSGTGRPLKSEDQTALPRSGMTESFSEVSNTAVPIGKMPNIMSSSFSGALPSSSSTTGGGKGPPMLVPRRKQTTDAKEAGRNAEPITQKPLPVPEKSNLQQERLLRVTQSSSPSPSSREGSPAPGEKPALPDKPKPPLKAKPNVMKKPGKSPEVLKRLKDRNSGDSSGSGSSKEGSPEVWTPQPSHRLVPEVDPKT